MTTYQQDSALNLILTLILTSFYDALVCTPPSASVYKDIIGAI